MPQEKIYIDENNFIILDTDEDGTFKSLSFKKLNEYGFGLEAIYKIGENNKLNRYLVSHGDGVSEHYSAINGVEVEANPEVFSIEDGKLEFDQNSVGSYSIDKAIKKFDFSAEKSEYFINDPIAGQKFDQKKFDNLISFNKDNLLNEIMDNYFEMDTSLMTDLAKQFYDKVSSSLNKAGIVMQTKEAIRGLDLEGLSEVYIASNNYKKSALNNNPSERGIS
jgi:hypothetical protein